MRRVEHYLWAALVLGLMACGAEDAGTEAKATGNETQKVARKEPGAKPAAAKCPNLATQLPVETPDLTRKVYACVERHALLYAKGPDSAETLSNAVMAKCKETIVKYVDQEAKKAGVRPPYKEAFESWQAHTLPIIAEARARRCFG